MNCFYFLNTIKIGINSMSHFDVNFNIHNYNKPIQPTNNTKLIIAGIGAYLIPDADKNSFQGKSYQYIRPFIPY